MTRDDIIRMAREAGGMDGWGVGRRISDPELRADNFVFDLEDLGRFAALVEAAEREACAKVCDSLASPSRLSDPSRSWITGTLDCASAIRARSLA